MKKYKLVNGEGWESSFKEGETYEGDYKRYGFTVEEFVSQFPNDWEEVVEEAKLPKKFKFKGDVEACGEDGSYGGLVVGDVYSLTDRCPDAEDGVEDYNFVKYYVEMYPNDWEGVLVALSPTGSGNIYVTPVTKVFTNAEVVTLITFLNDNFEDFRNFVEWTGSENLAWTFYNALTHDTMHGEQTSLLIDKIEKNDTNLTEAEKVTLITFLNDRFEDFEVCINEPAKGGITYETYEELIGYFPVGKASLLIDKIERS